MKAIRKQIGEFLKRHRVNALMSIEECSTLLEVDLKEIEMGKKKLPEEKFSEIQKLYKIPHEEVINFRSGIILEIIRKFNVNPPR